MVICPDLAAFAFAASVIIGTIMAGKWLLPLEVLTKVVVLIGVCGLIFIAIDAKYNIKVKITKKS